MKKIIRKLIIYILIISIFLLCVIIESIASSTIEVNSSSLNIYSPICLLMEKETGDILYEKNARDKIYPASTTKILTAILVLEKCYLNEKVKVSSTAISSVPTSYTTAELQVGEELSIQDLLYAMLIPSGNDAANVLAEHVSGSIPAFANLMNSKATEIGLTSSHFTNPSGIHDVNLYSTAYDLSLLARYAMNIEKFREIVKTASYTIPPTNIHAEADRTFSNSNLLLISNETEYYYPYTTGIKTGFTDLAGDCLVASSKKDNIEFIAVCLKAGTLENGLRQKFLDCKTLFDFAFANYTSYYLDLQDKNNNIVENLPSSESTNILTNTVQDKITTLDYSSYRILIKILAYMIILLALYFLFFRKKKNHYKKFKRRKR